MKKIIISSALVASLVVLSGCAPNIGGNDYSVAGSGQVSETWPGVIVAKRVVQVNAKNPENQNDPDIGMLGGGVAGAVLGSQIGSGSGSIVAGTLGALGGAAAGHFAQKKLTEQQGYEYQVKLDDGRLLTLTQGRDPDMFVGQRVLMVVPQGGGRSRVVPDNRNTF
jgi:outer membrane lipoprotein SlyB